MVGVETDRFIPAGEQAASKNRISSVEAKIFFIGGSSIAWTKSILAEFPSRQKPLCRGGNISKRQLPRYVKIQLLKIINPTGHQWRLGT
jgi:hypothetical protein